MNDLPRKLVQKNLAFLELNHSHFFLLGFLNSLSEILTDETSVDVYAVQSLSISTDSIIHLRYPKFFEEGELATHNILNYTFQPLNEPKFQTTLLYARYSSSVSSIGLFLTMMARPKRLLKPLSCCFFQDFYQNFA